MSSGNGIRLQLATMLLSIFQIIVTGMAAYIAYDFHDRLVRIENLIIERGLKNESIDPVSSPGTPSMRR